jgi:hypothetical protein
MNAKKAKALRKLMKNMSAQAEKPLPDREYMEIEKRAKYIFVQDDEIVKEPSDESSSWHPQTQQTEGATIESGLMLPGADPATAEFVKPREVRRVKIASGQIINSSNSKRALYLHLKKELRKVESNVQ